MFWYRGLYLNIGVSLIAANNMYSILYLCFHWLGDFGRSRNFCWSVMSNSVEPLGKSLVMFGIMIVTKPVGGFLILFASEHPFFLSRLRSNIDVYRECRKPFQFSGASEMRT